MPMAWKYIAATLLLAACATTLSAQEPGDSTGGVALQVPPLMRYSEACERVVGPVAGQNNYQGVIICGRKQVEPPTGKEIVSAMRCLVENGAPTVEPDRALQYGYYEVDALVIYPFPMGIMPIGYTNVYKDEVYILRTLHGRTGWPELKVKVWRHELLHVLSGVANDQEPFFKICSGIGAWSG